MCGARCRSPTTRATPSWSTTSRYAARPPSQLARSHTHSPVLQRNFACNPHNGLLIKPFNQKARTEGDDNDQRLLLDLRDYLLHIVDYSDFTLLKHDRWRELVQQGAGNESESSLFSD